MADEARMLGTEMVTVPDTTAAAEHAASMGLIAADSVSAVRSESAGYSAINAETGPYLGDAFVVPGYSVALAQLCPGPSVLLVTHQP